MTTLPTTLPKILHVYKSSAGSGKTTRLSIEYLKLALGKKDAFKHILALTFTNKAAQEMKDKILDNLQELVQLNAKSPPYFLDELLENNPKYQKQIIKGNKNKAFEDIQRDAVLLYKTLLHQYSEYAVTTLDSFTNRLIRSFSHDLGLSFNYQVELDSDQLLKDAVEELVNRVGMHEDMLTQVLSRYSQQKIDNETSRRINSDLEARAKSLLNDVEEEYLKPLRLLNLEDILKVQKKIVIEINLFEKQLQNLGEEFINTCDQAGIEADMFSGKNGVIFQYFNRFKKKDFSKIQPGKTVLKTIETGVWTAKSAPITNKQLIESVSNQLLNICHLTLKLIDDESSDYLLMQQIKKSIFPYMVLMELEKILNQIKQDNQMIHISDFNKIISEEIAQESAPYIYERIGNKYKHYLLDEFQDTSVIQWHNLLPLLENSLSENNYNLIVGDAKQAIYRWRGSEVEQFAKLPELLAKEKDLLLQQRENMLKNAYMEINLNTNYRSSKTIIEFNNHLFQFIKDQHYIPDNLVDIYKNHHQTLKKDSIEGGVVDIHFIDMPPKSKVDDYTEAYHTQTLSIIQDCLENDYQYKDIAVLARNNKHLIQLASFLIENNIPIVSSESLHVDSSPKVQFVLSFVKYLMQPIESVFQVEIIKFLLENKKLKDDHFVSLSEHLALLNPQDKLQKYWDKLALTVDASALLSLEAYEAIESIIRLFALDNSDPLLHFFIEAGFIFTQEKHQGLKEFMDWWSLMHEKFSLDIPEDWDAVKLMSFHKAKGLEFPVVINWFSQKLSPDQTNKTTVWLDPKLEKFPELKSFPFSLSSLKETKHQDIYKKEIEMSILDDVNIFYVANTRPTEKLFLLIDKAEKPTSSGFQFSKLMQDFITSQELPEIGIDVYRLGMNNSLKKHPQEKTENNSNKTKNIILSEIKENENWREHIQLALDQDKSWNESAAWGQKVHSVLAEINYKKDIETVFTGLVYRGVIDQEEQSILEGLVLQVIEHQQLKQFYTENVLVYNERDMVNSQGKLKRPDRMIILNDTIIIIDYKTGHPKEKDKEQVMEYMQMAEQFLKKSTKGYLVYLHEDIMVEEL